MRLKPKTRSLKKPCATAREIAFKALQNWEIRDQDLQQSFALLLTSDLEASERALSQELSYGVVRRKLLLDEAIRQFSNVPSRHISQSVLNILRLGLYQLLYLDRIPEHSAVDESVKLAKIFCSAKSARFINAVLRTFLRHDKKIVLLEKDPVRFLSISNSHPMELVQRWVHLWGVERTKALCEAGNVRPHWSLRVNSLRTSRPLLLDRLKEEGLDIQSGEHPLAIILNSPYPLAQLLSFREGLFQIQDEFMLTIIDELELQPHLRILDLCSAPGTKATAIAERMMDQGKIVALDRSFSRMKPILENMDRLGLHSIDLVVGDASFSPTLFRVPFDRILIDVPCSNTGVLAKRVEARWRYSFSNLKRLSDLQTRLLEAALEVLKPEGLLVYSTCSIDPAENEEVIQRVLTRESGIRLLSQKTSFPTAIQGGGYWAKLKRMKDEL
jgi:16S rRNA (cytosine967-C5)-methyltransferase